MKKLLVILILSFTGFTFVFAENSDDVVFCTDDAKQCSDGSWVGRSGPDCEFICPEDIQCNDIYKPVCASVEVQCIKAPCYPVLQTFGNICEMERNKNATLLHEGSCEESNSIGMANPASVFCELNGGKIEAEEGAGFSVCEFENGKTCEEWAFFKGECTDQIEEPIICPAIYLPVCGQDGKTYGNSCEAQKVGINYKGRCLGESIQNKLKTAWNSVYGKIIEGKTEVYKAILLEEVIKKADELYNTSDSFVRQSSYSYLGYLAGKNLVDDVYYPYIKENIYLVGPRIVGGQLKKDDVVLTDIKWVNQNIAYVYYKDNIWHNEGNDKIKIEVENGKIKMTLQESYTGAGFFVSGKSVNMGFKIPIEWEEYGYDSASGWIDTGDFYQLSFKYKAKKETNKLLFSINVYSPSKWQEKVKDGSSIMEEIIKEKDGIVVTLIEGGNPGYKVDENISNYSIMLNDVPTILNRMIMEIE